MRVVPLCAAIVVTASCTIFSGCQACSPKQNPEQLREKTAQATAALKQDAKAVAQGVREGWSRDHKLNLNTATAKQIASLPGLDEDRARKIIENRPYQAPQDLVRKRILSRPEYDRIADRLTTQPEK
jgi:DNA uptake protein ComE-like DNA-binding protein